MSSGQAALPPRDMIAELVRYNAQFVGPKHDAALLQAKLDRLCESPLGFLRGTFHLFVQDWRRVDDAQLEELPAQPIVGDLHIENYSAYRAEDGTTVFDVNDFDETGSGPPLLDLARLATSIVLADPEQTDPRAVARCADLVEAWYTAHGEGERHASHAHDDDRPVRRLISKAAEAARGDWLQKRVETVDGSRRFRESDKYRRITDERLRAQIEAGVRGFAESYRERAELPEDWPQVIDCATRIVGTGSLGRYRWAVLVESRNRKVGRERVIELKQALPSSLDPERAGDPAELVIVQQRLLQGDVPAYLGTAKVDGISYTVRELQPSEVKLDVSKLRGDDLDALCNACGSALGRLHRRARRERLPAIVSQRSLSRRIAAFALRYADRMARDQEVLRERRSEVEQRLGMVG